jgi:hypothetical protein
MDLLGHVGQKRRDAKHSDQEGTFETQRGNAPALLLGRLHAPLKLADI